MCPEIQWLISGVIRGFIDAPDKDIRKVLMDTLNFLSCYLSKSIGGTYMRRVRLDQRLHSSFSIASHEWRKYFPMV